MGGRLVTLKVANRSAITVGDRGMREERGVVGKSESFRVFFLSKDVLDRLDWIGLDELVYSSASVHPTHVYCTRKE